MGRGSPLYQARVEAVFPSQADDAVVALADLEAARRRSAAGGPLILAVDVAQFGNDKTTFAVRHGNVVRVVRSYGGRDLMRTTGEVSKLARELEREHGRRPVVVVDDAGLGGGVTDRLRELREVHVVAYTGAGKATRPNQSPNKRSKSWFALAKLSSGSTSTRTTRSWRPTCSRPATRSTRQVGALSRASRSRGGGCAGAPTGATRS